MKNNSSYFNCIFSILLILQSCNKSHPILSNAEKKAVVLEAKQTVQKIFQASNKHNFLEGLDYYSADKDAYYTSNGEVSNFEELKNSYIQAGAMVEYLENTIASWNARCIDKKTVIFTLPVHLKIKFMEVPEYNGQLIWSAVLQKIKGDWIVVQSHESWLNCVEVAEAFSKEVDKTL
ncbi:MAG: nuclear transport factor 2 family protein [Flavicella sp.]